MKFFVGRNQIAGPGASRPLESPGCPRLYGLLVQAPAPEAARGLGWPPRSCWCLFPWKSRSLFQNHGPQVHECFPCRHTNGSDGEGGEHTHPEVLPPPWVGRGWGAASSKESISTMTQGHDPGWGWGALLWVSREGWPPVSKGRGLGGPQAFAEMRLTSQRWRGIRVEGSTDIELKIMSTHRAIPGPLI